MSAQDIARTAPVVAASSGSRRLASMEMPSRPVRIVAWLVLGFLVLPSVIVIPMSFSASEMMVFPPQGFSLHLYHDFFFIQGWMETARQSVLVAGWTTGLSLLLGSTAAYGLVRSDFPGKRLVMMIFLSPIFVPLIVVALAFYIYFSVLRLQGSSFALIAAHTAIVTPFVIVLLTAALRKIDPSIEAAATTMGAGKVYVFAHVTLPMIRSSLISAGLFAFLLSFDELIVAIFLTGFDTKTLPVKMYESLIYEVSPVLAAISTLLTVLAFAVCVALVWWQPPESERNAQ